DRAYGKRRAPRGGDSRCAPTVRGPEGVLGGGRSEPDGRRVGGASRDRGARALHARAHHRIGIPRRGNREPGGGYPGGGPRAPHGVSGDRRTVPPRRGGREAVMKRAGSLHGRAGGRDAPAGRAEGFAASLSTIEEALRDIQAGRMVVVVDDEDRENEGDFVMAAEKTTSADVNFMAREARGLICVSMTSGRLGALGLSLMAPINTARFSTPFTVSVDLLRGTTSGSSAHDRALTIRALADPKTKPEDLARPGH